MLQTFTFSGARMIQTLGSYIRYERGTAPGDASIRVRADGQDLGTYLPGDAIRLPQQASQWEINPVTAQATGAVRIGVGTVESARLVGTVEVVDGGRARTLAGVAFFASCSVTTTAQRANLQCLNPVGSGVRTIIKALTFSTDSANVIRLGRLPEAAQLAVQQTTVSRKLVQATPGVTGVDVRVQALANIPAAFTQHAAWPVAANQFVRIALEEPYVLTPGEGIALACDVTSGTVTMLADGFTETL